MVSSQWILLGKLADCEQESFWIIRESGWFLSVPSNTLDTSRCGLAKSLLRSENQTGNISFPLADGRPFVPSSSITYMFVAELVRGIWGRLPPRFSLLYIASPSTLEKSLRYIPPLLLLFIVDRASLNRGKSKYLLCTMYMYIPLRKPNGGEDYKI